VLTGEDIEEAFPLVAAIGKRIESFVQTNVYEGMRFVKNQKSYLNINITTRGGSYRWHYDRNMVTGILYLNPVRGGELEVFPNYRIFLGQQLQHGRLQVCLDRILVLLRLVFRRASTIIEPKPGRLVILFGENALHSVRPVEDSMARINLIATFDPEGRELFRERGEMDQFVYTAAKQERRFY